MTKELKALKELKNQGFYYTKDGIDISTFVQIRLDIIETALKRNNKLEKENIKLMEENDKNRRNFFYEINK